MEPILRIAGVSKTFGGLTALKDIDIEAHPGKIVGIIGPNGAGKTTLFNCLTGLYFPSKGRIIFEDHSIVPKLSGEKMALVSRFSNMFLVLSLVWAFCFWAVILPRTYFKVEASLLALFILLVRYLVSNGLKKYQIWAWSTMFVFLPADIFFAAWIILEAKFLIKVPGTELGLHWISMPWAIAAGLFSLLFLRHLITKDVRQLFGFRVGPDAICSLGIARTFQNIRLFTNLSVLDNVKIGAHIQQRSGLKDVLIRTRFQREEEARIEQNALEHLRFVGLEHRAFDLAGALPYGEQRRLEIARALASRPKILLLDEPAAGMNARESSELIGLIRKIKESGITVLIIEHDMKVMMNLADTIYVLDHGELIASGTPEEIRSDPRVIEAYLGGSLAYAQT